MKRRLQSNDEKRLNQKHSRYSSLR